MELLLEDLAEIEFDRLVMNVFMKQFFFFMLPSSLLIVQIFYEWKHLKLLEEQDVFDTTGVNFLSQCYSYLKVLCMKK